MANSTKNLKELIASKELEKNNAEEVLKKNFHNTVESLNPANIAKNAMSGFFNSPSIVTKLIGVAMAAGTGFFIKKLLDKNSSEIMKKLSAMVIEFGIVNYITNNKEEIKNTGIKIFNRIFNIDQPTTENQQ